MNLFRKEISLESAKSKEEVIDLLQKNIEPFHKDSSNLNFEGRITPDGEFKMNLATKVSIYRRRESFIIIKGYVTEAQTGKSLITVEFSVSTLMRTINYIAGILFALITVVLLMDLIHLPGLFDIWFIPPVFYVFFMLNFYVTFHTDRKKAERILIDIFK
ncbi:MAG: hypothetical protein DI539_17710 [Flavobacterium psychrophilum]|nr:MAG: hypothetical protein DI539_17710 [Flavobacterium psychrophilum]